MFEAIIYLFVPWPRCVTCHVSHRAATRVSTLTGCRAVRGEAKNHPDAHLNYWYWASWPRESLLSAERLSWDQPSTSHQTTGFLLPCQRNHNFPWAEGPQMLTAGVLRQLLQVSMPKSSLLGTRVIWISLLTRPSSHMCIIKGGSIRRWGPRPGL